MIHAIASNKAGHSFKVSEINWRSLFAASEDSLTSSVFGKLFYLPSDLLLRILNEACYSNGLPAATSRLEGYEFWPKWNAGGTKNSRHVEPDVFIRFAEFDIIVEAKRFDNNQQSNAQWEGEVRAYLNEFYTADKPVYLLAVGGITTETEEIIKVKGRVIKVIKCRWSRLLRQVQHIQSQLEYSKGILSANDAMINILADLVTVFRLHGYATGKWLEDLTYYKINHPVTNYNNILKTFNPREWKL
ncbi:hypothetical protein [Cesiribacter sp. SM1]|uniref:hypothetical protein n=1 Tax=Cesiribacter sp. SM1 TaxID=2861196 RepID=UPI001CD74E89|nr:hypothetical protein [Cesiribacter sp. SM1]